MEPTAQKEVQARRPAICDRLRGIGKKMEMSSVKSLAIFAFAIVLPILLIPSSLAESKARSDLGSEAALLGETTQIPITLSANDEQIVATENEIIVLSVLSFVGAELGKAGEAVSAEVHTKLIPASEESKNPKLIVNVLGTDQKGLPSGVLVLLKFEVIGPIDEEQGFLDLTLENKAFVIGQDNEKVAIKGRSGTLMIMKEPPPVFACLFYMH